MLYLWWNLYKQPTKQPRPYVALSATTPLVILLLYFIALSLADISVFYILNSTEMPFSTRLYLAKPSIFHSVFTLFNFTWWTCVIIRGAVIHIYIYILRAIKCKIGNLPLCKRMGLSLYVYFIAELRTHSKCCHTTFTTINQIHTKDKQHMK